VGRINRTLKKIFLFIPASFRIEQAFGLLVAKWCIFKKPLEVKFWRTTLIIDAAFRVHNFCIDSRESSIISLGHCDPTTFTPTYMEYLDPLGDNTTLKSKWHAVRQALLQKIKWTVESDHDTT
jgi:hypothetical protein